MRFLHENQHTQRKFWYFVNRKLCQFLQDKNFYKWIELIKLSIKVVLLIFQVDSVNFWLQKLTLKAGNAQFFLTQHYVCLQDIKISFWHVDFYAKISLILDTRIENSTTQLTIIFTIVIQSIRSLWCFRRYEFMDTCYWEKLKNHYFLQQTRIHPILFKVYDVDSL